jgi:hypothetical protein
MYGLLIVKCTKLSTKKKIIPTIGGWILKSLEAGISTI